MKITKETARELGRIGGLTTARDHPDREYTKPGRAALDPDARRLQLARARLARIQKKLERKRR